jgi:hypothetical protein
MLRGCGQCALRALYFAMLLPIYSVKADCPAGYTCVPKEDMEILLQLARDQKCRASTTPKVKSDGVTIVTDRMGRVYSSGSGPKQYQLHLNWCNYEIDAKSNITLSVAQRVEPTWGFRLRLKATFGISPTAPGSKLQDALDGGVLVEPFYYHFANLNVYGGVKSIGLGLGFDLTNTVSIYVGYGWAYGSWKPAPMLGLGFALW